MKINILIILIVSLFLFAFSYQKANLKFTPSFKEINKGETVDVTVSVDGLSDNLLGANIKISFDKNILSVEKVTQGDFLKKGGASTFFNYSVTEVLIDVSIVRIGEAVEGASGNLFKITFKGKDSGTSQIKFSLIDLRDSRNNSIESTGVDGVIVVKSEKIALKFYIGNKNYFVNDEMKIMDVVPMIYEGRTLLPIRYVAEALGATVGWDAKEQKVTITFKGITIELWIGKNTAKVNGEYKLIDAGNPNVKPITIPPGRTMLPIRFIAENLGCKVDWNPDLKEVKITYPAE